MRAFVLKAVVFILLTGAVAPARAEEPTKRDKAKAKRYFRQGHRLFRRRKYSQAVEAFKRAYEHWKRREIHFNIAFAYARMGEKVKAVEHLREFLKQASRAERRKVPRILRKMQQQVGVLIVDVPDDEATIYIDGRKVGEQHVEVVVEPGKRVVEIRLKEKTVARKEMDAQPGMEKAWELTEIPRPEPRPRPRPEPRIEPVPRPRPRPQPTPDEPEPKKGLHWAYFTASAGLAVIAASVAVGTGVMTDQLRSDYEDNPTRSTMDKGNTMRNVTNAMWGVAAGAAVGAAVLAIFTRWSQPEESATPSEAGGAEVSIAPGITPGGVSLGVTIRH
jgi:hypothetical protein